MGFDSTSSGRAAGRLGRRVDAGRLRAVLCAAALVVGLGLAVGAGSAQTSSSSTVYSAPSSPEFLPSPPAAPGTRRIPVLMYHVIQTPSATAAFPGLWVPPAEFAGQMHALQQAGFKAISLDQAWAYWRYGAQLPAHPIIVTFDNGYASQYTEALPVLRAMGWIAVMNLQLSLHAPQGLSPAQVRGMVAAGWELDTQGFTPRGPAVARCHPSGLRGRALASAHPAQLRRPGQLVLLPVRALRPARRRHRQVRRLPRLDDGHLRMGQPGGSLPPRAHARARWHEPPVAGRPGARQPHRPAAPAGVSRGGVAGPCDQRQVTRTVPSRFLSNMDRVDVVALAFGQ